jgi:hypothetical protein
VVTQRVHRRRRDLRTPTCAHFFHTIYEEYENPDSDAITYTVEKADANGKKIRVKLIYQIKDVRALAECLTVKASIVD